ncbi:hypothetical protein D3X11_06595 [Streptococcus sp. X16XC17]|nr:hypothetical protein D3X11_06595 [Streptococcus sp. X16XC17]
MGTCLAGIGTGRILHYDVLKFPIEKYCQLLEEATGKPFSYFRYGVDLICVSLSFILSKAADLPLFVRGGTLMCLVLLSYVIGKAKK